MKKKLINALLIIIILLLSIGGGYLYADFADKIRRGKYPDAYSDEIGAAAEKYNIPKAVLQTLIKISSDFDPSKTDEESGRIGLCMLTEEEFSYLALLCGERTDARLRFVPEVSINLGACMLNDFYREFNDWDLVWAAVFKGEPYASGLLSDGVKDLTKADKSTKKFIEEANEILDIYVSLYPSELTQSQADVRTEEQTETENEAEITITQYQ